MSDIAPDEFYDGEYFKNYYSETRLCDEAAILIGINTNLYVLVSLGLRNQDPATDTTLRDGTGLANKPLRQLQTITPILMALCKQLWREGADGNELISGNNHQPNYGASLDRAFLNFGKAYLSERECEVVKLILKGHSSKSIARVLEISPDTVKVHRKRLHAKLQITSQPELFALFLDAITLAPVDSDDDSLTLYFAKHPPKPDLLAIKTS